MSFRDREATSLGAQIAELDRRLRAVEQGANRIPDPGWVLRELEDGLHYVFLPSGATGPVIGTK